jgi:hypothetical protein
MKRDYPIITQVPVTASSVNNFTFGGISPILSAGSVTIQGGASASNIIMAVEVREAASPVANTSGWWMILN